MRKTRRFFLHILKALGISWQWRIGDPTTPAFEREQRKIEKWMEENDPGL